MFIRTIGCGLQHICRLFKPASQVACLNKRQDLLVDRSRI
jgi:hypothetical protein